MKLLIVDNDVNIVKLIRAFLKEKGFEIIESGNGEEAFRIIKQENPDLALIDGLTPGIHGFEFYKKIKEDSAIEKRPKIIVMSSVYNGLKYKYETKGQHHADEYLQKSFKKEDLLAKNNALLL